MHEVGSQLSKKKCDTITKYPMRSASDIQSLNKGLIFSTSKRTRIFRTVRVWMRVHITTVDYSVELSLWSCLICIIEHNIIVTSYNII